MYLIKTKDCKGDGAGYEKANRHQVMELVRRLLEHGTKNYGDKITEITITRAKRA